MKLTRYEQETIINFNNSTQTASIYTASPQVMRRLDALATAYPGHYRLTEQTEVSKTYSCDKNLITLLSSVRLFEPALCRLFEADFATK